MRRLLETKLKFNKPLRHLMDYFRSYQLLDSTNLEASRLLVAGDAFHGMMIITESQTDGKGQYSNAWRAEPGKHLAMSIVLLPKSMEVSSLPRLSMKASLAIVRALRKIVPEVNAKIKWPNDIYTGDKKLAGILIENSISAGKVQHCIIGIGLNVNEVSFSGELPNAVSLHLLTNKIFDIRNIATMIRDEVMDLVDSPDIAWKTEYDSHLYKLDTTQFFTIKETGKKLQATVKGVDDNGKLMLLSEEGDILTFYSHEIKWVL